MKNFINLVLPWIIICIGAAHAREGDWWLCIMMVLCLVPIAYYLPKFK